MTERSFARKFSQEFPDFPAADFPALPEGFTDSSWHNDVCPSMKNETLGLFIFVDYADRAKREAIEDGNARFAVLKLDNEGFLDQSPTILTTDVWQDVIELIDSKRTVGTELRPTENIGSNFPSRGTPLGHNFNK